MPKHQANEPWPHDQLRMNTAGRLAGTSDRCRPSTIQPRSRRSVAASRMRRPEQQNEYHRSKTPPVSFAVGRPVFGAHIRWLSPLESHLGNRRHRLRRVGCVTSVVRLSDFTRCRLPIFILLIVRQEFS